MHKSRSVRTLFDPANSGLESDPENIFVEIEIVWRYNICISKKDRGTELSDTTNRIWRDRK